MEKCKYEYKMNKAVLFLIFNRLDTAQKSFEQIRIAKPPRFYLASDGARPEKEGEKKIVELVRKWVLDNIDWDCEVKTLFRDENLGCGEAISSAISWFFEHEADGIIIEDDIVVSQSFFRYCEELLEKYKNDNRIMMVTGCCYLKNGYKLDGQSYFFYDGGIYGWATWRRAWKLYDKKMTLWENENAREIFKNFRGEDYFNRNFLDYDATYRGKIDTWDYQWVFTRAMNNGLTCTPCTNLSTNIGFGHPKATHTISFEETIPLGELEFPLVEPKYIAFEKRYGELCQPREEASVSVKPNRRLRDFFFHKERENKNRIITILNTFKIKYSKS
ncbi:MAG: hypothetical protein WCY19_02265 [Candidatus Gastranaerophilaceae bacterium]